MEKPIILLSVIGCRSTYYLISQKFVVAAFQYLYLCFCMHTLFSLSLIVILHVFIDMYELLLLGLVP